jgi:hypothetical protein
VTLLMDPKIQPTLIAFSRCQVQFCLTSYKISSSWGQGVGTGDGGGVSSVVRVGAGVGYGVCTELVVGTGVGYGVCTVPIVGAGVCTPGVAVGTVTGGSVQSSLPFPDLALLTLGALELLALLTLGALVPLALLELLVPLEGGQGVGGSTQSTVGALELLALLTLGALELLALLTEGALELLTLGAFEDFAPFPESAQSSAFSVSSVP